MNTWKASDAKRHFAEVMQGAASSPQVVLLRGEPVGVVVSYESYIETKDISASRTIAGWLSDLAALNISEGDLDVPSRTDRADQFGDAWQ